MNILDKLALIGQIVAVLTGIRSLSKGETVNAPCSIRYPYKKDTYRITSITITKD